MTRKLYYEDSHQKSCAAQVLECSSAGSDWEIVLDQTVFFPEGGGQPCDKGRIGTQPVLRVREKAGIIYHRVEHPLDPGTPVESTGLTGFLSCRTTPESISFPA